MQWTLQISTFKDYRRLLAEKGILLSVSAGDDARPPKKGSDQVGDQTAFTGNLYPIPETLDALAVNHLSYDSRKVTEGTLFFCKGAHFEPQFLLKALEAGAVAYVSEHDYSTFLREAGREPTPSLIVKDIRSAIVECAAWYYRGLLNHLTLVGITGTKGKSTTTYMLRSILDSWLSEQGKAKSAWLSSIENYDGISCDRSLLTTQDTFELYEHFAHAVSCGIEYLTMEVSSQALKYARTGLIPFEVAGFLNIGHDHISDIEHPNHEDYVASKLALFEQSRIAVVNQQTEQLDLVLKAAEVCEETLTFGFSRSANVVASEVTATAQGLSFLVSTCTWNERFTLPMAGTFNVENALAAIAMASALDIPVEHMQKGLENCEVSGRMQLLCAPEDKLIIIDYAHNKLSFETLFSTITKEYPHRPVVCVFGATGSKGIERRLDLPEVASRYAEMIYITEDDPGEEPLEKINEEIAQVVRKADKPYTIIEDRGLAIATAIKESPRRSLVLILGKGHETVMKRGRESVPVATDKEHVEAFLKEK